MSVYQYGRGGTRRWRAPVTIGVAVAALAAGGLGVALADSGSPAAAASIVCPGVAGELPAIPARAQAEVDRNLALLQKQIDEANARLAGSVGQGGPNFVQNAILGPLKSKRVATIDRIAISIGRAGTRPTGLDRLATCSLSTDAAPPADEAEPPAAPPADEAEPPAAPPAEEAEPPAAPPADEAAGAISCPDVAGELPAVPAQAQAEVARNLALLDTQIAEANRRLASTVGQGGPNFVRNAILGPLEDKRFATINRIATAIGRNAARPAGLDALAPCALSD
jgi:hypothetical protein